jgi:hypothetical protein
MKSTPMMVLLLAALMGALGATPGAAGEMLVVGPTAASGVEVPPGWQPVALSKAAAPTRYRMVREVGADVLRAEGRGSGSGLYRPLEIDPTVYRVIAWRWKIQNVPVGVDAGSGGGSYPAQVYVKFRYDPARASLSERMSYWAYRRWYGAYPHAGVLRYVWDSRRPRGAVLDVPGARKERVVVLRSGSAEAGRWVQEERNVFDDYRQAFGREPFPVVGVGVMTDTDGAAATTVAWYGQIALRTVK